jgi:hypothetical protein
LRVERELEEYNLRSRLALQLEEDNEDVRRGMDGALALEMVELDGVGRWEDDVA